MPKEEQTDQVFTIDSEDKPKFPFLLTGIAFAVLLAVVVIGFAIFNIVKPGQQASVTPEVAEAKSFVQDFTIHFYNLSAGFFEQERDKTAKYMNSDVLKAYQSQFYDSKLLEKINKHRLATSFDIERVDFVAKGKTEYQFRILGNVKFTSLTLNTYIQYPFSHMIKCAKTIEGWKVSDITPE